MVKSITSAVMILFASTTMQAQVINAIQISIDGDAQIILVDSLGRRTGHDPIAGIKYAEIPRASYGDQGVDSEDSSVSDLYFRGLGLKKATTGIYNLKVIGTQQGSFGLTILMARGIRNGKSFSFTGATSRASTSTFRIMYSTDTTVQLAAYQIYASPQVRGGIFNPAGGSISVRAKSAITFGNLDTLRKIVVTLRWPSWYNLTLGASSSSYGIAKWDSVISQGGYNYQKFRTTTQKSLNWTAGSEYELFTVGLSAYSGIENFDLTNVISTGQWYVEIDSTDYSDTAFYQGTATGFAYQNKSSHNVATFTNGERHIVKGGGKLHEAYLSGNEIIYRRSTNSGQSWEVTSRITGGDGNYLWPTITAGSNNSLHIAFQHVRGTLFELYYARSTDNGTSWSVPRALKVGLTPSASQASNIYPVIAEQNSTPKQIIIAYVCVNGLFYARSRDNGATWPDSAINIPSTWYPPSNGQYIWYLSLAPGPNFLTMTYDYRYNNPNVFSRSYDGSSWTSEASVAAGIGTQYDRYSSVAVDDEPYPVAAWCAQRTSDYRILFRLGGANNTWSAWFVEFSPTTGISDYWPSITYLSRGGVRGYDIIYHRSNQEIRMNRSTMGSWQNSLIATSGMWANTSIENNGSGYPFEVWTDQSASPYQVKVANNGTIVQQQGMAMAQGATPLYEVHRRVVVQDKDNYSTLSFEVQGIKVITSTGDSMSIPFKSHDWSQPFTATLQNVWDYLGTDPYTFPPNAKSILVDINVDSHAAQDSIGTTLGVNSFTSKSYSINLVNGTQTQQLLTDQTGSSGIKQLNVSQFAGQTISIRPVGIIPAALTSKVIVGIGEICVPK